MSAALLVLRIVPGLLFMGHGLQKLVPARYSPPLLHATGPAQMAGFFEQIGLRPGLLTATLAGLGELGGGLLIALGLVTPLAAVLLAAVMTTAILTVHLRKGIWSTEGGFEYPLVMLTVAYAVAAIGPGAYSVDSWAGIGNWAGVHWAAADAVRAGAAVGIGAAAGLLTMAVGRIRLAIERRAPHPA
ncbi:MAG: DoxX family protein [Gaiellaceae bacterium]